MSDSEAKSVDQRWDEAVSRRLGKLRSMPVDVSRLEQRVRAQVPPSDPASPAPLRLSHWTRGLKALRAVAAGFILLVITAALLLSTSGGPAVASPVVMAQLHEDIVSGRTPVMQVESVTAANQALAKQWAQSPQIPNVPNDHIMACCMRSMQNKKVACVLLNGENEPVTMTVANAADMDSPKSPTMTRNGVTYHVQSKGSLNMVMTERNDRWVCLVGRLPVERLMELASNLEF
jgi:hypothetical protein